MKRRISTLDEFINEKNNQFYKQNKIKKGMILKSLDAQNHQSEVNTVKVLDIKKDTSGMYDVEVEFITGELKGDTDKWYLENDDEVFIKESKLINEGSIKGSKIVKILSNTDDWGEEADLQVYTKGNNAIYLDTFFYGKDKALDLLIKSWSPGGDMYDYFINTYKIKATIVDSFFELKAKGRHKKLTNDGIVGVELSFEKI